MLGESPGAREIARANFLVKKGLERVDVTAISRSVQPGEEDETGAHVLAVSGVVAPHGAEGEHGEPAEEEASLGEVLSRDPALGGVVDDHGADSQGTDGHGQADVHLQLCHTPAVHAVVQSQFRL